MASCRDGGAAPPHDCCYPLCQGETWPLTQQSGRRQTSLWQCSTAPRAGRCAARLGKVGRCGAKRARQQPAALAAPDGAVRRPEHRGTRSGQARVRGYGRGLEPAGLRPGGPGPGGRGLLRGRGRGWCQCGRCGGVVLGEAAGWGGARREMGGGAERRAPRRSACRARATGRVCTPSPLQRKGTNGASCPSDHRTGTRADASRRDRGAATAPEGRYFALCPPKSCSCARNPAFGSADGCTADTASTAASAERPSVAISTAAATVALRDTPELREGGGGAVSGGAKGGSWRGIELSGKKGVGGPGSSRQRGREADEERGDGRCGGAHQRRSVLA